MTTTKKLTRDAPGLFIEATLFTCLARFCRHFKGNPENLDPAALRRFTFKLEFDYLTDDGKRIFFQRMFAPLAAGELTPDSERCLLRIPDLTPGDFRTVRQECHYLEGSVSSESLLDALERESAAKRSTRSRNHIGGFACNSL